MDAAFRNPRIQSWNLNVQRELFKNLGLMVGYFGSKGDHLRVSRNVNQFVNGVRPYPRLSPSSPILPGSAVGNITEVTSLGYSRYNALWVSLNQRFTRGLQFNASYTLSSSKDTNSLNSQGVVVQNSYDIGADYAASDYDARHRYVLSAIWELPFKGNRLVEGWQVSVVTQGQSGNPINVLTNIANLTGNANVRPDLVGNHRRSGAAGAVVLDLGVRSPEWPGPARRARSSPCRSQRAASSTSATSRETASSARSSSTRTCRCEEDQGGRSHRGVPGRSLQRLQPSQLRPAGPDRSVGSTSFGLITATRCPTGDSGVARQIQFALKVLF